MPTRGRTKREAKVKTKVSNKKVWLGVMIVTFNVIALLALTFLIIELNYGMDVISFIVENLSRVIFVVASVIFLSALTFGYIRYDCQELLENLSRLIEVLVLLDLSMFCSSLIGKYIDPNARPFAFFALMCATVLNRKGAIFFNVINALLIFIIDININLAGSAAAYDQIWQYCAGLLISFCSGTLVVFFMRSIKTRLKSILLVFLLLIPIEIIVGIMEVLFSGESGGTTSYILFAYGAFGAFVSVVMYMVLLPVFEFVFSELTVFRLRELTAPDAKLIKKLKTEAPGTYNHSVVVAQLAEACANAIGDDSELARAAAYYHDVGKLRNPEMFTENQADYNMHNELSPELSADIIRSHAKDGAKLIKKHHLPEFFADIAVQHHGTLPIKYFYAKALKMSDGEVNLATFSYTGPTPQSRIAAIIMIADAAEAACRSSKDRSAAKVQEIVNGLIEERINLGQFEDCDITMRQLSIISHTIAQSLSGVYHSRIEYPKIKIGKKG